MENSVILDVSVDLDYALYGLTDILLQIEAAPLHDQLLLSAGIGLSPAAHFARIAGEENIGERIWLLADTALIVNYNARVQITRADPDIASLGAVPPYLLPGDAVRYLMASRYCPSTEFQRFVAAEFGSTRGGALVANMRDWITEKITYLDGVSTGETTARDTIVQRHGVCRDFAHVLVTFCRAAAIPARVASVFAPDVTPMDFHAVADIYLDGAWHLVDATGMAKASEMARIGVGSDAADVAFLTTYGQADFRRQVVQVSRV